MQYDPAGQEKVVSCKYTKQMAYCLYRSSGVTIAWESAKALPGSSFFTLSVIPLSQDEKKIFSRGRAVAILNYQIMYLRVKLSRVIAGCPQEIFICECS